MKELDDITGAIVDTAFRIHRDLGPGMLESVYELVLERSLAQRGLKVVRQHAASFEYDGILFADLLRLDLLVENRVVIELKSIERFAPVHTKQLLTYLRLTGHSVGLLINFGAPRFSEAVRRLVLNLPPSSSPRLRVNRASMRTEATE
jgi:iron complex transport system substrate-binding protein